MLGILSYFGNTGQSISKAIGVILFCGYILFSYLGLESLVVPAGLFRIFMYAFLSYTALYSFLINKVQFEYSKLLLWQFLFLILSFVTFLYSPEPLSFSGSQFYTLIVNFVFILCLTQYRLNFVDIKLIAWIYVLSSVILLIYIIKSGFFLALTTRLDFGEESLLNVNSFSNMLMVSVIFAFWLLMYGDNNLLKKIILIAATCLIYYGMLMAGGRKFVIVPILFLYIMMLFQRNRKGRKRIIINTLFILIILSSLYCIIMYVPIVYNTIGVRMEGLLALLTGSNEVDASASARSSYIAVGLNRWIESPLWGYGINSFRYYNKIVTGDFVYSHNNYVELLYNYGLVGFILYYSFYYKMIKYAWINRRRIPQSSVAFVLAIFPAFLVYEIGAINYTLLSSFVLFYIAYTMIYRHKMNYK